MKKYNIELVNESGYTPNSSDNIRQYHREYVFANQENISCHGMIIEGEAHCIICVGGGATGVHEFSMIQLNESVFVAVGDRVTSIDLETKKMLWSIQIDEATCFGVHYSEKNKALVAHGELLISRFTEDGKILWQNSGLDIFTEGIELKEKFIEVTDFNNNICHFDYKTGSILE